MPGDLLGEFLRWLDIIPGRHWLVVSEGGGLDQVIEANYRPSGVSRLQFPPDDRLPFPEATFDVAVAELSVAPAVELLQEVRRVIAPSGTVGLCIGEGSASALEALVRQAGLHAVQSVRSAGAVFVRGAR